MSLLAEGLAVARLVRLVQTDSITEVPREQLLSWLSKHNRWRTVELMQCGWCGSVWAAGGLLALRLTAPRLHAVAVDLLASSYLAGAVIEYGSALAGKLDQS